MVSEAPHSSVSEVFSLLAVGEPSGLIKKAPVLFADKKPRAIALQRISALEKQAAIHCVKFETATLAPL